MPHRSRSRQASLSEAEGIFIQSVTLSSIAYGAPDDIVRWHYEVAIWPSVGGKPYFKDLGSYIVILMDGSIVEPTRTNGDILLVPK